MKFEYEYIESQEEVRKQIQVCEGKHTQQVCYSTFHDALTQICFGCKKIRSTIEIEEDISSVENEPQDKQAKIKHEFDKDYEN